MEEANVSETNHCSVLFVESNKPGANDRKEWVERLFEHFNVPSLCTAQAAPLSLYASGRTSGIVVECGASLTTCTPVFDGQPLTHAINQMELGGADVTAYIRKFFIDQKINIDFYDAKVIKEKLSFVNLPDIDAVLGNANFELPDGTELVVPLKALADATEVLCTNNKFIPKGLCAQLVDTLKMCDDRVMECMANNIIISGGVSMTKGLGDRLDAEVNAKLAALDRSSVTFRQARVMPSKNCSERGYTMQRKHAAWVGGSILSSLELYPKLSISRQEYDEIGIDRCLNVKYL